VTSACGRRDTRLITERDVMTDPVHVFVHIKGFTEAWYQLLTEEQETWVARVAANLKRQGGAWLVECESRWANEDSHGWGVIRFPSIEACQATFAENERSGWYRYCRAETMLGTELGLRVTEW
jgi:hypothetical protein